MATIKAPFNFVPLAEENEVYYPEWQDKISHDIPFSDSFSGVIDIELTAKSSIFVRNGHVRQDAEEKNNTYKSFSQTSDGRYFIPGTSIKGSIRNVFEILTFSKASLIHNESFGLRDLTDNSDGKFYRNKINGKTVRCGWLQIKDNEYLLEDCGFPWRISPKAIDEKCGTTLDNFVKTGDFSKDENRLAKKKYELFGDNSYPFYFDEDEELCQKLGVGNRRFVKFSEDGEEGLLVFTGQSSRRQLTNKVNRKGEKIWGGKYFEFVFPVLETPKIFNIDNGIYNSFISVHRNSPDYKEYWKGKLNANERIPVFFTLNSDGDVDSMGLSYMYKYSAYNSIYNALPKYSTAKRDLTECVFGFSEKNESQKGRVSFGHAYAITEVKIDEEYSYLLGSPNPSYYPLYLGNGQTWNSEDVRIAGRKRYPVREHIMKSMSGTDDMMSHFIPLKAGAVFGCKVRFHNLKPLELSSLLASLLFNGISGCYHSLGMGKPYGFGKTKINIKSIDINNIKEDDIDKLLSVYQLEFKERIDNSKAIKELYAMASGIPQNRENDFSYMQMSLEKDKNEFVDGKTAYANGTQLGLFTEIIDNSVPKCIIIDNVAANKERINLETLRGKKEERQEKYRFFIQEGILALKDEDFEHSKDCFNKAADFVVDRSEVESYLSKVAANKLIYSNQLETAAELFVNDMRYDLAIEKYKLLNDLGIKSYLDKIFACEEAIKKTNQSDSPITDCITTSSLPAFINFLSKCRDSDSLTDEECKIIGNKLKAIIETLNNKNRSKWSSQKEWKKLSDKIGEEKCNVIYNLIFP